MQSSNLPTFKLGLIGYPLGHTLSPKIHTAALQACGLDGDYSLFPIVPGDRQGLKELLDRVRAKQIHGLNVTIPHKQNVIEFLDELTPSAQTIGAVNTIFLRDDKLIGDNTDASGFLSDLRNFLADQSKTVDRKSAIVLVPVALLAQLSMPSSATAGMSPSPPAELNKHNNSPHPFLITIYHLSISPTFDF